MTKRWFTKYCRNSCPTILLQKSRARDNFLLRWGCMPKINVKDKRKQQLIDANMASIAKRGLVDTTITHVSDGANMSRGIVNFYFTSKEKMMQETLAFLMAEQNACWQEALAATSAQDPMTKVETIILSMMGDKLCSARRVAVLSAFIGHAGTHAGYAKLIRSADELFTKQVKTLLQQAGTEAKLSEFRARQILAFIRGHHVAAFLNSDWGKPSSYSEFWIRLLRTWADKVPVSAPATLAPKEKPAKVEPVKAEVAVAPVTPAPSPQPKPKKAAARSVLPGQLDFGDLFSRN